MFRRRKTSESELEAMERATERKPRFTKSELSALPLVESATERAFVSPPSRTEELEKQIKEMEAEKKMLETEKGLHHLMEEIHPSKRARAAKLLKYAIGGVRGTTEGRAKRRESLKKGIRESVDEVIKILKERKAQKESESQKGSGFKVPTKYYENVLGRGWVTAEKPRKHVHHRKKRTAAKRRAKYRSSDYSSFFEPMERYEPRERYYEPRRAYPRPRKRIIYYGR